MPADLKSLLRLQVPLIVQIADRLMPVEEVMNLAPGAIIELPKRADEELSILVNNKAIGAGRAVKVGENFGVRVTYIGNLRQRIAAMGEGAAPASEDGLEESPGPAEGGHPPAAESDLMDTKGHDETDGTNPAPRSAPELFRALRSGRHRQPSSAG